LFLAGGPAKNLGTSPLFGLLNASNNASRSKVEFAALGLVPCTSEIQNTKTVLAFFKLDYDGYEY
jgi:hypothetical protein